MAKVPKLAPDPTFPQLALVADAAHMRSVFQDYLNLDIEKVRINRFQYAPSRNCSICYELEVHDAAFGQPSKKLVYGLIENKDRPSLHMAEPAHQLAELDMGLWQFPYDPELVHLPQLMDGDALLAMLNEQQALFDLPQNGRFQSVVTNVVKYVPGGRCVLKHTLWQTDTVEPALTLYSKTFLPEDSQRSIHILRGLWESAVRQNGELRIPEPYFFAQHMNTLFLEALPGDIASDTMGDEELLELVPQCGRLLAALHQCQISGLDASSDDMSNLARLGQDSQEQLAAYNKTVRLLVAYNEDYAASLATLSSALETELPLLAEVPITLIHTAFRFSQILAHEGKLALLDFDGLKNGNPIGDVASFVAHLYKLHVKHGLPLVEAEAAALRFCAAYREAAPWGLDEGWLFWQTAVILISKHAKRCIKRARKNPEAQIQRYLTLANELINGARLNGLATAGFSQKLAQSAS